MSKYPKLQLSRLRQIGWDEWDPIGLRSIDVVDWQNDAPDEYDSYLLHVVSMLRRGQSAEEAVAYLEMVASEHMGLGPGTAQMHRACVVTVDAIEAYLQTLPDGALNVR